MSCQTANTVRTRSIRARYDTADVVCFLFFTYSTPCGRCKNIVREPFGTISKGRRRVVNEYRHLRKLLVDRAKRDEFRSYGKRNYTAMDTKP